MNYCKTRAPIVVTPQHFRMEIMTDKPTDYQTDRPGHRDVTLSNNTIVLNGNKMQNGKQVLLGSRGPKRANCYIGHDILKDGRNKT